MVFNQARFGQLSPRKEVPNLIPDNPNLRPADIFIHSFVGGNDTALDVTVVSPMSVNLLDKEAREPGASLEFRYKEKVQKYHQLLHGQNIKFSPLVITTLGGWHTASVDILYRLSEAVAKQEGQDVGDVQRQFMGRLAVTVQSGNASLLLSRQPIHIPEWAA